MPTDKITIHCPTCQHSLIWNDDYPYRPFCSKRCQLIDLGEWANGEKHIAGSSLIETEDDHSTHPIDKGEESY